MATKVIDIGPANGSGFDSKEVGTFDDVSSYEQVGYIVAGTFAATIKIQISADGSAIYNLASTTTPTAALISFPVKLIRGSCSSYTSGAAFVHAVCKDTDLSV